MGLPLLAAMIPDPEWSDFHSAHAKWGPYELHTHQTATFVLWTVWKGRERVAQGQTKRFVNAQVEALKAAKVHYGV